MREIVNLQIGAAGINISLKFWEIIANEHGLNTKGEHECEADLERISSYFNEIEKNVFRARAVSVDLDTEIINFMKCSPYAPLFQPQNYICGEDGSGNNFARGRYTEGANLIDEALNIIRKEAEQCDSFQGFQFVHGIGGGTGSGTTSLLLENIKEEYPCKNISTFTVGLSPSTSDIVVEPYNATATFPHLTDKCHENYIIDNEALYDVIYKSLKIERASYSDLNHLIALSMSGITTCCRFPKQLNLRKVVLNMVTFPKLHYFVPGFVPLTSVEEGKRKAITIQELVDHMFDAKNIMCSCNPCEGKYLAVGLVFRGKMPEDVNEQIVSVANENCSCFGEKIPKNVKTISCDAPLVRIDLEAAFMGNTTAIQNMFKRITDQFSFMFRRKAFLHWYTGEGMDESEFLEAESDVRDLILEYQQADDRCDKKKQYNC